MNVKATEQPDPSGLAEQVLPALVEAGTSAIALMNLRTMRGEGIDDQQMKAYSKGYAKRKAGPTDTRNLTVSGSMMRSLHLESVRAEGSTATVVIGFSNAEDKRKAEWNEKISPWFGASPADRQIIIKQLQARLGKSIQESKR